jgi:hypothetical protein
MLHEGTDFPKERREIDVWVDGEIEREKNNLITYLTNNNNNEFVHDTLLTFTRRIANLIGQHNKGGLMEDNNNNEM